jgi:hypothetical protein
MGDSARLPARAGCKRMLLGDNLTATGSFIWDDPFLSDQQLSDDECMMRDATREFAEDKLLPRVIEAYARS